MAQIFIYDDSKTKNIKYSGYDGYFFILNSDNYMNNLVEFQKIFDKLNKPTLVYIKKNNKFIHMPNSKNIKFIHQNDMSHVKWFEKKFNNKRTNHNWPILLAIAICLLLFIKHL